MRMLVTLVTDEVLYVHVSLTTNPTVKYTKRENKQNFKTFLTYYNASPSLNQVREMVSLYEDADHLGD